MNFETENQGCSINKEYINTYLQVKNNCEGVGVPAIAVGCSALR